MTRTLTNFRLVPFAALALGLHACDGSPTESATALDVSLTTNRSFVSPSTPVQFTITITNRSNRARIVDAADGYACPAYYEVRDKDQHTVELPSRVCALVLIAPRTLEPGESMTVRDSWSGDKSDGSHGAVPLAAGVYHVTARIPARGDVLTSAPVPVTIQQ